MVAEGVQCVPYSHAFRHCMQRRSAEAAAHPRTAHSLLASNLAFMTRTCCIIPSGQAEMNGGGTLSDFLPNTVEVFRRIFLGPMARDGA
jgi:hypothetical protein